MKCIMLISWFLMILTLRSTSQSNHIYADLLNKYVTNDGRVDYKGFIKEKEKFTIYLDYLSENLPSEKTAEKEKLSYWINAYNAFTIKLIIDNYPLESITDLNPFFYIPFYNTVWYKEFFKINDVDFNLDRIEHEILRKEFNEARIHFAINCASKSCPNLRNEPYEAKYLDFQLTEQTKKFLMDEKKNHINQNHLELSKIFSWFEADFERDGSVIDFINKYVQIKVSSDATIDYLSYDWSLNE